MKIKQKRKTKAILNAAWGKLSFWSKEKVDTSVEIQNKAIEGVSPAKIYLARKNVIPCPQFPPSFYYTSLVSLSQLGDKGEMKRK